MRNFLSFLLISSFYFALLILGGILAMLGLKIFFETRKIFLPALLFMIGYHILPGFVLGYWEKLFEETMNSKKR